MCAILLVRGYRDTFRLPKFRFFRALSRRVRKMPSITGKDRARPALLIFFMLFRLLYSALSFGLTRLKFPPAPFHLTPLHFTLHHYTSPNIITLHLTSLHFTSHHYTSPQLNALHIKWSPPILIILNPLTPNGHYSGRIAPLTSRRCILNIYSTNICTEYFKHAA
jgi:hypothetical protein